MLLLNISFNPKKLFNFFIYRIDSKIIKNQFKLNDDFDINYQKCGSKTGDKAYYIFKLDCIYDG